MADVTIVSRRASGSKQTCLLCDVELSLPLRLAIKARALFLHNSTPAHLGFLL